MNPSEKSNAAKNAAVNAAIAAEDARKEAVNAAVAAQNAAVRIRMLLDTEIELKNAGISNLSAVRIKSYIGVTGFLTSLRSLNQANLLGNNFDDLMDIFDSFPWHTQNNISLVNISRVFLLLLNAKPTLLNQENFTRIAQQIQDMDQDVVAAYFAALNAVLRSLSYYGLLEQRNLDNLLGIKENILDLRHGVAHLFDEDALNQTTLDFLLQLNDFTNSQNIAYELADLDKLDRLDEETLMNFLHAIHATAEAPEKIVGWADPPLEELPLFRIADGKRTPPDDDDFAKAPIQEVDNQSPLPEV